MVLNVSQVRIIVFKGHISSVLTQTYLPAHPHSYPAQIHLHTHVCNVLLSLGEHPSRDMPGDK